MPRQFAPLFLGATFCVLILSSAQAQWISGGVPLCTESSLQNAPVVVSSGAGGAIVLWGDPRTSDPGSGIYAQRVDAGGHSQWTTDGVLVSPGRRFNVWENSRSTFVATTDGADGAIVAYQDMRRFESDTSRGIVAQRIDANGQPAWDDTLIVAPDGDIANPLIAADGAGGAFLVWPALMAPDPVAGLYGQHVTSAGARAWGTDGLKLVDADFATTPWFAITPDGSGNFIVVYPALADAFRAQRFDMNGDPMWTPGGVPITEPASPRWQPPAITLDGAGGAVVATTDSVLRAQKLQLSDGGPQWGDAGVIVSDTYMPAMLIPDGAGGVVASWYAGGIKAQRLDANGNAVWATGGVVVLSDPRVDWQFIPMSSDGNRGAYILARTRRPPGSQPLFALYAQHVDGAGANQWVGKGFLLDTQNASFPAIISDGNGGAIAAWEHSVAFPDNDDIYAQHLDTGGALVPTLLQSHDARQRGDGIEISWLLFDEGVGMSFAVARSIDGGAFSPFDTPIMREGRAFLIVDPRTSPGRRYQYRITVSDTDGTRLLFESKTVTIAPAALVLEQNVPNPFNPETVIRFSLPVREQAAVDVYSAGGEHVVRLGDAVMAAGMHEVSWNGTDRRGRAVSSGLYYYRLTAGKQSMSRKMVLLK